MKEGRISKGGVGNPPTRPRPKPPKGQGGSQKLKEVLEALEFYADESNWKNGTSVHYEWATFAELDEGKRARKALEKYRGVGKSG